MDDDFDRELRRTFFFMQSDQVDHGVVAKGFALQFVA